MNILVKKIGACICLLICLNFWIISFASADEPNAKECIEKNDCNDLENKDSSTTKNADVSEEKSGSIVFYLIKVFFALLLVLALIYLLLKFLNKRNKAFQQVKTLENIGGISVGQNKSIQIIRIGNRVYVVGVGDNVELLHEMDEVEKEDLLHMNKTKEFQSGSLITSLFQQKKTDDGSGGNQTFKNLFASELEKLKDGRKKMIDHQKRKGDKDE